MRRAFSIGGIGWSTGSRCAGSERSPRGTQRTGPCTRGQDIRGDGAGVRPHEGRREWASAASREEPSANTGGKTANSTRPTPTSGRTWCSSRRPRARRPRSGSPRAGGSNVRTRRSSSSTSRAWSLRGVGYARRRGTVCRDRRISALQTSRTCTSRRRASCASAMTPAAAALQQAVMKDPILFAAGAFVNASDISSEFSTRWTPTTAHTQLGPTTRCPHAGVAHQL